MSTKKTLLLFPLFMLSFLLSAQVKTNFKNNKLISNKGQYIKGYRDQIDFEISAKNIEELLKRERKENEQSKYEKPFRFAEPVSINLDIAKGINWVNDKGFAYGKFTIKVDKASSTSINFDKFYLPKGTEMYVYNENGNMITGPVTENENNSNQIWGSWVYKGEYLTIELKTPIETKELLLLHSNNIAYGYKEIYKTEVGDFGQSAACNINVICPLGTSWEAERNSVALILSDNGDSWCSGSMVMNTCNTSRPFFLTANHCFNQQNVAAWRFTFQAWSTTCPHPGTNSGGVTYNGSTLRANSAATDFCLVELNTTPPANSGIHYAGWNRNTNGITQSTIIHHPRGDVMKITRDNEPPVFNTFLGANCWQLVVDQGTTEGGSSGAPYFDQNHRIIAQHYGINDGNLPVCQQVNKFGGRFDLSWTGGGTNATRLSNWLDPGNSGVMTTNTTNITNLSPVPNLSLTRSFGQDCNSVQVTANVPSNTPVTWTTTGGLLINGNASPFTTTSSSVTISSTGTDGSVTASTQSGTCTFVSAPFFFCPCLPWSSPSINWIWSAPATGEPLIAEVVPAHPLALEYHWYINGQLVEITPGNLLSTYNWPCTSEGEGLTVVAVTSCGTTAVVYGGTYSPICYGYSASSNVSLYPNPASSQVTIKLEELQTADTKTKGTSSEIRLSEIVQIKIIDKTGLARKIIKPGKGTKLTTIDVSALASDIYFLDITDNIRQVRVPLVIRK